MRWINVVPLFPDRIDWMIEEAKRLKREYRLDEVAVSMSLQVESTPVEDKIQLYRKSFASYKNGLANSGIKVGILFQSLIGHGWSGAPESAPDFQQTIGIDGQNTGRLCPLDANFQAYVFNAVRQLAEEKPASMLVDDDTRLISAQLECFCPLHLNRINQLAQTELSQEQLRQAILDSAPGDRILNCFEQVRTTSLFEFAALIRSAIDSVDPSIRCGYCTPGAEFLIAGRMAKILAGSTRPFLRYNNGMYLEESAKDFPAIMGYTQMLSHLFRDIPEQISEGDTFPHNLFSKSATSLHSHLTGSILNGARGSKLWITNFRCPDFPATDSYHKMLGRYHDFYETLEKTVTESTIAGPVSPILFNHRQYHPLRVGKLFIKNNWTDKILGVFGIPGRHDECPNSGHPIVMLSGSDSVNSLDDAAITRLLSGSLLLDGTAAIALSERGFSDHLGVNAARERYCFSYERIHSSGELMSLNNDFICPKLTVNHPDTEILSSFYLAPFQRSPEVHLVAPATTIFSNRLGGKVAVWAMHLAMSKNNLYVPGRKYLLLETLDKLNGSPLEYVAMDMQNLYCLQFKTSQQQDILAIFNLNFDRLPSIRLRLAHSPLSIDYLAPDGSWAAAPFQMTGNECTILLPLGTYENLILRFSNIK